MDTYSVFGNGTGSSNPTVYTDGGPNITLGNYFYTYDSIVRNCVGGRVYIPYDGAVLNQSITIMAWKHSINGAPVDLGATPLRSGTTTTSGAAGWTEVLWDTPFTVGDGELVFIGYAFGGAAQIAYIHAPSPSNNPVQSNDNLLLVLAEADIDTTDPDAGRGRFKIGTAAPGNSQAWYGADILLADTDVDLPLPIAEYSFNETEGIVAHDTSGNSYDMTLLSESNINVGRTGNALHQVGDGSAFQISLPSPWLETPHRTIMFWGRRGTNNPGWSGTVRQIDPGGAANPLAISLSDGDGYTTFYAHVVDAEYNAMIRTSLAPAGSWHHYALTFNGVRFRAYVDGELIEDRNYPGNLIASDGNMYFFGGLYQQQAIDDLRFFDTSLSQPEVQAYMDISIEPSDDEPPTVPANVEVEVAHQVVTLTWAASTDNVEVQNYVVYRGTTIDFVPSPTNQVGGPELTTYTETAPVGTFYYRVAARDETGNESEASVAVVATTELAPAPTSYNFPSDLGWSLGPASTDGTTGGGISLGIICALVTPTLIGGGRYYSPVALSGVTLRLYANSVEVASKTGIALSVGWNELDFDAPYGGAPGIDYLLSVYLPGATYTTTALANAYPGTRIEVGPMYTTISQNSRWGNGDAMPSTGSGSWYGLDIVSLSETSELDPTFGATVALENDKQGAQGIEWSIYGAGDSENLGFARQFSINSGDTVEFSCHGAGTHIDIYRIGYYGGLGWRRVAELTNTATAQPNPETIPGSNGGTRCSNWSITASWDVPKEALAGLYVGVYRNDIGDNASYIPFVARNDAKVADIVYKTSDTTWALAYNYFGTPAAPYTGKSLYGSGGPLGDISTRTHAVSYHRPIITREGVGQTYWLACEAPLIRFLERNGYDVTYVASRDIDADPSVLSRGSTFISSGHDEYWTEPMRDAVESFRDGGGHALFMSGNEVFWRTRFEEDRNTMWCYKDTMHGPGEHIGGMPLDPVSWTGTWKDTRWVDNRPEYAITGTDFRMNGVSDHPAVLQQAAAYTSHVVWRNSALRSSDVTLEGVIGFEADRMWPLQPETSTSVLAAYTFNINGSFADDNGQNYAGNGDLEWGIVSQRYASGAVVVGFGTCQWSWGLDQVHDRGGSYAHPAAQQFMVNLLGDLGAQPATLMAGMVTAAAQSLDNYGIVPESDRSGKAKVWNGMAWSAHPVKVWDGSQWIVRKTSGSSDGATFTIGKG